MRHVSEYSYEGLLENIVDFRGINDGVIIAFGEEYSKVSWESIIDGLEGR